jgi:hypothetical protein
VKLSFHQEIFPKKFFHYPGGGVNEKLFFHKNKTNLVSNRFQSGIDPSAFHSSNSEMNKGSTSGSSTSSQSDTSGSCSAGARPRGDAAPGWPGGFRNAGSRVRARATAWCDTRSWCCSATDFTRFAKGSDPSIMHRRIAYLAQLRRIYLNAFPLSKNDDVWCASCTRICQPHAHAFSQE